MTPRTASPDDWLGAKNATYILITYSGPLSLSMHMIRRLKSPMFFFIFFLISVKMFGQADTLKPKKHYFELSFGQSLLFITKGQSAALHSKSAEVVPTNSVLFFAEFRPER